MPSFRDHPRSEGRRDRSTFDQIDQKPSQEQSSRCQVWESLWSVVEPAVEKLAVQERKSRCR